MLNPSLVATHALSNPIGRRDMRFRVPFSAGRIERPRPSVSRVHAALDRFTVTFDEPNYVYVDEITVEVTGGVAPAVIQTRRRENDGPDSVEIVLDGPVPMGETTRFTFDDGVAVNVIEYTFAPGDTDGTGRVDLRDVAAFQACFGGQALAGPCQACDFDDSGTIELTDFAEFRNELMGP